MPGKRSKDKQKIAFWITRTQREMMHTLADEASLNMSDMFREMLEAYATVRKIKVASPELEEAAKKKKKKTTKPRKENT